MMRARARTTAGFDAKRRPRAEDERLDCAGNSVNRCHKDAKGQCYPVTRDRDASLAIRRNGGSMKSGKTVGAIACAALLAIGVLVWMLTSHRPHLVTASFDPPYPETNSSGDPILAVLEGRIPCSVAGCDKRKVALVLYESKKERAPATYWLGVVGTHGNDTVRR